MREMRLKVLIIFDVLNQELQTSKHTSLFGGKMVQLLSVNSKTSTQHSIQDGTKRILSCILGFDGGTCYIHETEIMLLQILDTLLLLLCISTYKYCDKYSYIITSQLRSKIHLKNCRS